MRTFTSIFGALILAIFLISCASHQVRITPYHKTVELINGRNTSILLEAKDLDFDLEDKWIPKNFFTSAALSPDGKYLAFIGENKFWQVVGFVDVATKKVTRIMGLSSPEKWLSVEWGPGSRLFIVRGYNTNGGERNVTIFDVQKNYQVVSFMDKLDVSDSTIRHVDIEGFKWMKEDVLRVEYWYLGKQEKQVFVWNAKDHDHKLPIISK